MASNTKLVNQLRDQNSWSIIQIHTPWSKTTQSHCGQDHCKTGLKLIKYIVSWKKSGWGFWQDSPLQWHFGTSYSWYRTTERSCYFFFVGQVYWYAEYESALSLHAGHVWGESARQHLVLFNCLKPRQRAGVRGRHFPCSSQLFCDSCAGCKRWLESGVMVLLCK